MLSRFAPVNPPPALSPAASPNEFERLWRGFMTARTTLGLVLMLLQARLMWVSPADGLMPLLVCAAYFGTALSVRLRTPASPLGSKLNARWLLTVGVDLMTFASLQLLQGSAINYTPLFALPVLIASVLGSTLLSLGAAALVTLMLFAHATWLTLLAPWNANTHFLQAALTGMGCFAIAVIANQVSRRLASVELQAQHNQLAAEVQGQVNELVIQSLTDGILIVDQYGQIRSANPSAHQLLSHNPRTTISAVNLNDRPGWHALRDVVLRSFVQQSAQEAEIEVRHAGFGSRQLRVRTQMTNRQQDDALDLCVVFLQDQLEVQARIRAEKLASMGRMSAAVAHEIRNPLAAISQANALLTEDLSDAGQRQLAHMVQQNTERLERIVQDILHLTHTPNEEGSSPAVVMADLTQATHRICRDWQNQHHVTQALLLDLPNTAPPVWFEGEHLRRILVNLLDNAARYATGKDASMQVHIGQVPSDEAAPQVCLRVWSDGSPLAPSVEQHLFEPFFTSESRSSGLGLYICRELCESHGALMAYERSVRVVDRHPVGGNAFCITFRSQSPLSAPPPNPHPA